MINLWFLALTICIASSSAEIPSTVHKCHYGDHSCITKTADNLILNYGRSGIKDIGLIPFDPLHLKSLKLERNANSPVNIELAFKDIDVTGLSDMKIRHIKGLTENINDNLEAEMVSPKIVLKGPYTIDGSVLILPIVGKGNSEVILASTIQKCHFGDTKCIAKITENIISHYGATGIREMGLIPFDPLHVKSLKLERNRNSPVNIELAFKDIDVIGLSNVKVLSMKGFTENLNDQHETVLKSSKITIRGPYSVDGSVLVLPVVGKGNSEIVLNDVALTLRGKNKAFQKNGKTYFSYESLKLDIKPRNAQFRFDALFNGNKELGDTVNKFVNENWSDIFEELRPAISEAFGLILKHTINNVFAQHPYEDFFEH